jgi:hypothetical protein
MQLPKLPQLMKQAILVAAIGTLTFSVHAGDWGKAPVGKAPIEECIDIGGQISAGYMTDYYFHGMHSAEDSVWVDVNYTFTGLGVPITFGVMYLNGIHPFYFDQLDIYLAGNFGTFAGFDTTIAYTHHFHPEDGGFHKPYGELGLGLRRSLGFADLVLGTNYMFGDGQTAGQHSSKGWYHEVGLEKSIPVADNISLVLAGGAGYLDGILDNPGNSQSGSGWNHYYLRASLPIQLNCRTTLTPYVAYRSEVLLGGFTDDDFEDDNIHAGVSLSVSF